ncbi:PaaI family thioesterase [Flavobacterium degerlachei]|jgi:hypothetical protein|uniref:Acyl-coenzyme A thioesterase PaaI, contains HGG motif n=1 Tax=Flavobacterium degerlachei TaxID=229203 RepID=A0A1H2URH4_9FLAO|nr:DUF4442 domain-containing protein [Flavobacterium degerlachei]SDW58154.1 protein of unknown function [Flavobacterium degerlachei]
MSVYKKLADIGSKFVGKSKLFKHGFNYSPMYRRSTAKIIDISEDLLNVSVKLPISYKNKNYVNSIFGGSMFSAVDPIPMVQLMNLLGDDFVVWDKSAEIYFKKPAKENLYAEFNYTAIEVEEIKSRVQTENEIEITKITTLTNIDRTVIYCEVRKTIYVAVKSFYIEKKKLINRQ